jgi:hypothetical protein
MNGAADCVGTVISAEGSWTSRAVRFEVGQHPRRLGNRLLELPVASRAWAGR